jgi:hypothetical protein
MPTTDTCPVCGADVTGKRPTDWPLHRYVCTRCRDAARRGELAVPARCSPRHTSAGPHRADTSQTEGQPCT